MKEQHTSVKYTHSELDTLPDKTDWARVDVLTDEDINEVLLSHTQISGFSILR